MATPQTYAVPPAGALLLVVERAGEYGLSAWPEEPNGIVVWSTSGVPSSWEGGVPLPYDAGPGGTGVAHPEYVWLDEGERLYARAFDVSSLAGIGARLSVWLRRPKGA